MGRHALFLIVGALIAAIPVQAEAVLVTQNYEASATFTDGGPVSIVGFGFGITYDPAASFTSNAAVNYFSSTSSYPAFRATPVDFTKASNSIFIYAAGFGLNPNAPDFQLIAGPNPTGTVPPLNFSASYTVGDGTARHVSSFGNIHAVPEPSTWATMLCGMALIGRVLRRRLPRVAGGDKAGRGTPAGC